MRIMALIPARGGSKGIPHKNIFPVLGKPLIRYTVEQALAAFPAGDVFVTSDSDEILSQCGGVKKNNLIRRPDDISADKSPILPAIIHALEMSSENYDAVCLLQPTSPVRPPALLPQCIAAFEKHRPDSLFTVTEIPARFNPQTVITVDVDGFAEPLTFEYLRRQDLRPAYYRTGQVYMTTTRTVHAGSLYGRRVIPIIRTDPRELINIDTPEDLESFRRFIASSSVAPASVSP